MQCVHSKPQLIIAVRVLIIAIRVLIIAIRVLIMAIRVAPRGCLHAMCAFQAAVAGWCACPR